MGWEATETVAHEHDAAGQLVASRITRETEWDDWQRSLALALVDLENSTDENGHPLWESTDPTAVDQYGEYRYVAGDPVINFATRAAAAKRKEMEAANEDMTGVHIPVFKVPARRRD